MGNHSSKIFPFNRLMNHVVTVPPLLFRSDCVAFFHRNGVLSILTPQLFAGGGFFLLVASAGSPAILQNYRLMRERSAHINSMMNVVWGGKREMSWCLLLTAIRLVDNN
jgi:hypothetical protein